MKAVVYHEYGAPDVLKLTELEKPVPKANEVLIRIRATTVTAEDPKQRAFTFPPLMRLPIGLLFGFRKPKKPVLGFELSGVVEAHGEEVTRFSIGDELFGYTGLSFGAYAEYKCMPEDALLAIKPETLSFEEAAAIPNGALSALVFLKKKGNVTPGEKVLIYGAAGSVGSAAIQLAKALGGEVTAVCSTKNMPLMQKLGADYVIDYTQEDFTTSEIRYDVIFDTVGKTKLCDCQRVLNHRGRYLLTVFGLAEMSRMLFGPLFGSQRVIGAASNLNWEQADLEYLRELYEKGQFKPVVDRRYSLTEVAEAHAYVEQGHKVGNVVLTV